MDLEIAARGLSKLREGLDSGFPMRTALSEGLQGFVPWGVSTGGGLDMLRKGGAPWIRPCTYTHICFLTAVP